MLESGGVSRPLGPKGKLLLAQREKKMDHPALDKEIRNVLVMTLCQFPAINKVHLTCERVKHT
jgi:hypothetical protein